MSINNNKGVHTTVVKADDLRDKHIYAVTMLISVQCDFFQFSTIYCGGGGRLWYTVKNTASSQHRGSSTNFIISN